MTNPEVVRSCDNRRRKYHFDSEHRAVLPRTPAADLVRGAALPAHRIPSVLLEREGVVRTADPGRADSGPVDRATARDPISQSAQILPPHSIPDRASSGSGAAAQRRYRRALRRWADLLGALGMLAVASACGSPGASQDASLPGVVPADPSASQALTEEFPYGAFADPATIDNKWLPLPPGTQFVWDGETVADGEAVAHRIVLTVTDMTKVIDGVETRVAFDEDYSDGELVEAEIFFLAQDDDGNVWRMGEYPEEYDAGEFVDAPAWLAGAQDALAGYWMTAAPAVGDRSYAQGWGPEVGWADRGKVVQAGIEDCVELGCYENVLVIEEWALDEPDAKQLKYYAPGVGNIRVGWSGSPEQEQENLELVEWRQISEAELDEIRSRALALEEHAYEIRPEVFGETEPMRQAS
jgi:hypothetical protein